MRIPFKIVILILVGILLVYGTISYMIIEIEDANYERIFYTNHHFLFGEISKFAQEKYVTKKALEERVMEIIQLNDNDQILEQSLVATKDGKPLLGNPALFAKLNQRHNDIQMLVSFLPNDWILITQIPRSFFSHYQYQNGWLVIFSLTVLIILTLVLYKVTQRILAKPLKKLTLVTQSLLEGDVSVEEFKVYAHSEMGLLASEIFALREKLENVSKANKKLEEILGVSYLEKMDIREFTLAVFETLSSFIDSRQLHLYKYHDDELKEQYSYPKHPNQQLYPELAEFMAERSGNGNQEQVMGGEEYTLVIYPLEMPDRFLGYLVIEFPGEHQLRPQDREIIEFVRTRLVYAIINTQYFKRLEMEKEKLHIHSSKMELLVILANELREVLDLPSLYQAVCQKLCDYFGFNMALLLRYDAAENGYRCHGFFHWEAEVQREMLPQTLLQGQPLTRILKEIYLTGREMQIQDVRLCLGEDRKILEEYLELDYPEQVVLLPVFRNRRVEGVLALDLTGVTLDPAMVGLLKIYSQIVGEEIARLDLLQEREQYVKELEIERKRLNENIQELEQTKEALATERFKRLKDNLITEFSHDMRTPLTVLSGYLDLIRKNIFNREMTDKIIKIMQEETNCLISMVENLLESAKILSDGGDDGSQMSEVKLSEWLGNLVKTQPLYRERVILKIADEEISLYTDESKLNKIMTNLIENGCKYSEDQVEVLVEQSKGQVQVRVKDYGIGIAEEYLEQIFTKFYRVKNAATRGTRGSGLGLFIVGEYLEQLGGHIQVLSTPGQGTTFLLQFPMEKSSRKGVADEIN